MLPVLASFAIQLVVVMVFPAVFKGFLKQMMIHAIQSGGGGVGGGRGGKKKQQQHLRKENRSAQLLYPNRNQMVW